MSPSKAVIPINVIEEPNIHEQEHVHEVYDSIAPHFSSTRYKPWPIVAQFLESLPSGWVGLDSGTGNGKYLPLPVDRPSHIWTIGLDRSRNLLEIAKNANADGKECIREVVWGDVLARGWRTAAFDYAISIATIHHLSTPTRRKQAVQTLLLSLSPSHGRALIYVWAIQQDSLSKRTIPRASSRSQGSEQRGQDVFVPWVSSQQQESSPPMRAELRSQHQEPQDIDSTVQGGANRSPASLVYNRYYHMFDDGELRELVYGAAEAMGIVVGAPAEFDIKQAADPRGKRRGIEIIQDGWERSNFYVELRLWEV